jgi:hypothetical protein
MKKWISGFIVILLLAVIGIYIFIPSSLQISAVNMLNSSANGSFRVLSDQKKWHGWFPTSIDSNRYTIDKRLVYTVYVTIRSEGENISSVMQLLPISSDSTGIQWRCSIPTSNNPFTRIQRYQRAVGIKNEMDTILSRLSAYVKNPGNIYGFPIERTSFTDTLLLATKTTTNSYPTTNDIYQQVTLLRAHIEKEKSSSTGNPMANITKLDSNKFQLMVAMPVNRVMNDSKAFFFRRMIPGNGFIRFEVKGGPGTVKEALHQMQLYFSDYRKTAMAIPFEQLVTDRMAVPDTSQWITRIYMPVF